MLFIALFFCALVCLLVGLFSKQKSWILTGALLLLLFLGLFVYFVYILPENG